MQPLSSSDNKVMECNQFVHWISYLKFTVTHLCDVITMEVLIAAYGVGLPVIPATDTPLDLHSFWTIKCS